MIQRLEPPFAAGDLDSLAGLVLDAIAANASIGFPAGFTHDAALAWWEHIGLLVSAGEAVLLGARDAGSLVGTAQLRFSSYPNGRRRAEVAKLLVHSRARGRGLARQLMAGLEDVARAQDRPLLYLDTETGSAAERLYTKLGWTAAGVIPEFAYRPDGELRPTTLYYKRLSF
jgi:GNAT superfamily N-acetyltransferase